MENFAINDKYFIQAYGLPTGTIVAKLCRNTPKGKYKKSECVTFISFRTENQRFDWAMEQANKIHEGDRQEIERKANQKAAVKANAEKGTVKAGAIFSASWGYDQTNVDFYEVIEAKGQTVVVREIRQNQESTGLDYGKTMPQPGKYSGPAMTKRVNFRYETPFLTISSCQRARLWDGKAKTFSSGH